MEIIKRTSQFIVWMVLAFAFFQTASAQEEIANTRYAQPYHTWFLSSSDTYTSTTIRVESGQNIGFEVREGSIHATIKKGSEIVHDQDHTALSGVQWSQPLRAGSYFVEVEFMPGVFRESKGTVWFTHP